MRTICVEWRERASEREKCAGETKNQSVAMKEKWEVSYARFLNVPASAATEGATDAYPRLQVRRITKSCKEYGTWLVASSPADLKILVDSYNADVVMRVHYRGSVMEEHFISKLNISWPQVSCESSFPPRGTRVVTVTYKDEMEEVQKFAFQFSTICGLETFLNALKVYMKDARTTLDSNFGSRFAVSTPQIYKPLIDIYSRIPLTSLSTQDNGTCSRELASVSNFNKRRFTSEMFYQQAVVEDLRASSCKKLQTPKSVHQKMTKSLAYFLPTMFTSQQFTHNADLEADNDNNQVLCARSQNKEAADHQRTLAMSNCEADKASNTQNLLSSSLSVELEQCQQHQDIPTNTQDSLEAFPPSFAALLSNCYSSSEQAATPQSSKVVEVDLKSRIARYMEDSSFQDMLMKVESVIGELGYMDALDG